jgi:hypothetical protein
MGDGGWVRPAVVSPGAEKIRRSPADTAVALRYDLPAALRYSLRGTAPIISVRREMVSRGAFG